MIQTMGEGGEIESLYKTDKLYSDFDVNIETFDDTKMSSNDNVFSLEFIGKNGDNKGIIYYKMYNNNDINSIKDNIDQPNIKNKKLIETILYCLSKDNDTHNIVYKNNDNQLNICIEWDTGLLSFNIILNIPGKLSDIDTIKNELKKMTKIVKETKKELFIKSHGYDKLKIAFNEMRDNLAVKTQEINDLKQKINDINKILNEIKANPTKTTQINPQSISNTETKGNDSDYDSDYDSKTPCPPALNKNPLQWTTNDIKGIIFQCIYIVRYKLSVFIYVLNIVWVSILPKILQPHASKLVELGLNGVNIISMTASDLYSIGVDKFETQIKKEFESWLPNTKHKQLSQFSKKNFNWDNVSFKPGQCIDIWYIYLNTYKPATIIDVLNNGIKIHWNHYDNTWDQIIYKIHYKNRINSNKIKLNLKIKPAVPKRKISEPPPLSKRNIADLTKEYFNSMNPRHNTVWYPGKMRPPT